MTTAVISSFHSEITQFIKGSQSLDFALQNIDASFPGDKTGCLRDLLTSRGFRIVFIMCSNDPLLCAAEFSHVVRTVGGRLSASVLLCVCTCCVCLCVLHSAVRRFSHSHHSVGPHFLLTKVSFSCFVLVHCRHNPWVLGGHRTSSLQQHRICYGTMCGVLERRGMPLSHSA